MVECTEHTLRGRETRQLCKILRLTGGKSHGIARNMLIYKIFRRDEWTALEADGSTQGAPIDLADGYIHFSTAAQARETAAKYFSGVDGLILAAIPAAPLGADLKWEAARGGDLFPHLYRDLSLSDVEWHTPLPLSGDTHSFPDSLV